MFAFNATHLTVCGENISYLRVSMVRAMRLHREGEDLMPARSSTSQPMAVRAWLTSTSNGDRFEKLYELFARLAARNDLDSALQEVLDASIDVMGAHAGLIRLFLYEEADPIASYFPFVANRGISEAFLNYFSNLDQPLSREGRQAMYDRHRLLIEDMISHEYYQDHREVVVAEGYRTQLSIPLMSRIGPKCVGVLTTFFREIQTPRHADLETLNLYAELAATTIDQHQHSVELVRRSRLWASIAEEQAGVL